MQAPHLAGVGSGIECQLRAILKSGKAKRQRAIFRARAEKTLPGNFESFFDRLPNRVNPSSGGPGFVFARDGE